MASSEPYQEPYLAAIRRGFQFARELGCRCGTVHLLVGISEGHDQAAAALGPRQGPPLRAAVAAAGDAFGDGAGYLHMQAQGAARSLARRLGQPVNLAGGRTISRWPSSAVTETGPPSATLSARRPRRSPMTWDSMTTSAAP